MSKVRVNCFAVSLDGYGAGPEQSLEEPLGKNGEQLHDWFTATKTFRSTYGDTGGTTGIHDDFARRAMENLGAWILGRNMFGPVRGEWPDESWRGWWGQNPPYHVPVFVLTHHPRKSLEMEGGTTFHFVTDGPAAALSRARELAGDRDISIAGGASTVNQFLAAGLLDELRLHISPLTLGAGERLFDGVPPQRFEQVSARQTSMVTHVTYRVLR